MAEEIPFATLPRSTAVHQTAAPVHLPATELHRLRSESVGDDFELRIARPLPGLAPPAAGPPRALWVLDADLFFGAVVDVTRLMHRLFGELPPLLVVGVGYPGDDFAGQARLRSRDLTPTEDSGLGGAPPTGWGDAGPPPTGGAAAFRRFLLDEAAPWVSGRFEVADGGAILFGSSLGGLFVVDTFLREPGHFDGFIAASPALWWDDEVVFGVEEEAAALGEGLSGSLFLGAGSLEEDPRMPWLADFRLVTNVRRLAERLAGRGHRSLEVEAAVVDGEGHTTAPVPVLTRGLRRIAGRAGPSPVPGEG